MIIFVINAFVVLLHENINKAVQFSNKPFLFKL